MATRFHENFHFFTQACGNQQNASFSNIENTTLSLYYNVLYVKGERNIAANEQLLIKLLC